MSEGRRHEHEMSRSEGASDEGFGVGILSARLVTVEGYAVGSGDLRDLFKQFIGAVAVCAEGRSAVLIGNQRLSAAAHQRLYDLNLGDYAVIGGVGLLDIFEAVLTVERSAELTDFIEPVDSPLAAANLIVGVVDIQRVEAILIEIDYPGGFKRMEGYVARGEIALIAERSRFDNLVVPPRLIEIQRIDGQQIDEYSVGYH